MPGRRKGILLAGGTGSRLYPATKALSKHLLPVYDKPMIYYPLATLMRAGIREIAVVATSRDLSLFQRLLGNGEDYGVRLTYLVQQKPEGIAQGLLLAEDWLAGAPSALILGDNILLGDRLGSALKAASRQKEGATLFAYRVRDPRHYGVFDFDENGKVRVLVEKPAHPPSEWASVGLYFYDEKAPQLARTLSPSKRGELEITDLNMLYLKAGKAEVKKLGRTCAWLDAGLPESLLEASQYIHTLQARQGVLVGSPEDVARKAGWIDAASRP